MALWVAFALIASATMYTETAARRRAAAVARAIAMLLVIWIVTASGAGITGAPMLVVGLAALAWAVAVGRAWPAYEAAWASAAGGGESAPDKRSLPVFANGIGLILLGVAQAAGVLLFSWSLGDLATQDASWQIFLRTTMWSTLAFSLMFAAAGAFSLVFAAKRNPWFAAQVAYAVAALSPGASRAVAMNRTVALALDVQRTQVSSSGV